MADDSTKISGRIEVRTIDGQTKRVIVCSECCEVAGEIGEDSQINRRLLQASLDRHILYRHNDDHAFETYDRAKNRMEPGIVLSERRIN